MKKRKFSSTEFASERIGEAIASLVSFVEGKNYNYMTGILREDKSTDVDKESDFETHLIKAIWTGRNGIFVVDAYHDGEVHCLDFTKMIEAGDALILNKVPFYRPRHDVELKNYMRNILVFDDNANDKIRIDVDPEGPFGYVYDFLEEFVNFRKENGGYVTTDEFLEFLKDFILRNAELISEKRNITSEEVAIDLEGYQRIRINPLN